MLVVSQERIGLENVWNWKLMPEVPQNQVLINGDHMGWRYLEGLIKRKISVGITRFLDFVHHSVF
jgi:hypothetical protein